MELWLRWALAVARFGSDLIVKALSDRSWRLTEELIYQSDILGLIVVPDFFITDFASVPRLPLAFLVAGDTAHAAAVVHDWLYTTQPCTRMQADRTFREAMGVTGIPAWRKNIMFAAVVSAGWLVWNKRRQS